MLTKLLITLALAMGLQLASAAPILIDSFDSPGGGQRVCSPSSDPGLCPGIPDFSSAAVTGALGGNRDILVTRDSGTGRVETGVNTALALDQMAYSSTTNTRGTTVLQWDGSDSTSTLAFGLGGVDFSSQVSLDFQAGTDIASVLTFQFFTSAGNFYQHVFNLPNLTTGTFQLPLASFTATGNPDWSNINAVQLTVVGGVETDLNMDFIRTTEVPEPGTWLSLGAGLLLLANLRRRR